MVTGTSDKFLKSCTDGASSADPCINAGGGVKFVQAASASASGMTCQADTPPCSSTCTATSCPLCCQNLWPVVDSGVWIGWMARVSFDMPSAYKYLEETLVVHL
jgi:hypothetical protein